MYQKLLLSALVFSSFNSAIAQEANKPEKPRTKLETFIAQDGTVIVRGFSRVGTLNGLYSSSLSIENKEFINPATSKREYGITVEVTEKSRIERTNTSYIDFDEIESLIKGLDYISKIDKSSTKLDDFQADYKTRGDLQISTFSTEGTTMLAVKSGRIGSTSAYFRKDDISKVRDLIVSAKQKLDSIRQQ